MKETLEEAAEKYARKQCDDMYDNQGLTGAFWGWETSLDFIAGAKWQAEKMYSEEDLISFAHFYFKEEFNSTMQTSKSTDEILQEWFEQFKKNKINNN